MAAKRVGGDELARNLFVLAFIGIAIEIVVMTILPRF